MVNVGLGASLCGGRDPGESSPEVSHAHTRLTLKYKSLGQGLSQDLETGFPNL